MHSGSTEKPTPARNSLVEPPPFAPSSANRATAMPIGAMIHAQDRPMPLRKRNQTPSGGTTLRQGSVTNLSLMARYQVSPKVSVQLNGNNLLDRKYFVLDQYDNTYYGAPAGQQPLRVPESALRLVQDLVQATEVRVAPPVANAPPAVAEPIAAGPTPAATTIRAQLATSARQLYGIVDGEWRQYLALPREVFDGGGQPATFVIKHRRRAKGPQAPRQFRPNFAKTQDAHGCPT